MILDGDSNRAAVLILALTGIGNLAVMGILLTRCFFPELRLLSTLGDFIIALVLFNISMDASKEMIWLGAPAINHSGIVLSMDRRDQRYSGEPGSSNHSFSIHVPARAAFFDNGVKHFFVFGGWMRFGVFQLKEYVSGPI